MPRDSKAWNAYMREYLPRRYANRKAKCIEKLGGSCKRCGSTEDLQFDHIDPKTKSFTITDRVRDATWKEIDEELEKCQLLCVSCHLGHKTVLEKNQVPTKNRDIHGTLSSYRYCKCDLCKSAMKEYNFNYRNKISS